MKNISFGKFFLLGAVLLGSCLLPAPVSAQIQQANLPYRLEPAFPSLNWNGWEPISDDGQIVPLRPISLIPCGDGSNRLFMMTQRGVIHVFPNKPDATETKVFLDVQDRVRYYDKENEEGLLGLAFHPDYAENGEFFVYYTTNSTPHTSIISRFRVSPDDPDKALADSEEEIFRLEQPFWNHNGGRITFGPDGYLYVGLGDGGKGNDPFNNAQNLGTLLGSILRIDVDSKSEGKGYGIPKDNPFVDQEGACPEIYAYGLRNVWGMEFDPETKKLWAADVGQNVWEEINIIEKGGNYGWNLREGFHIFAAKNKEPTEEANQKRDDLKLPVWEYHHDIGKSITGGFVYRGKKYPDLQGAYLYGDYVTGLVWALYYDEELEKVTSNKLLTRITLPLMAWGQDEQGELYLLCLSNQGKGVYQLVPVQK
ncbi:Soluble aldose sugar dehydrogenase YliI [Planctomycetales bacterium 10988]|nr:Soluble aldose sugar dehydrogenase YliI [Planctomycetales bacterium 10988]